MKHNAVRLCLMGLKIWAKESTQAGFVWRCQDDSGVEQRRASTPSIKNNGKEIGKKGAHNSFKQ
jgi:hypothetical protein